MDFPSLETMFFYIAVPFTVFLIIQTILTFMGIGETDADAELDADGGDFDGSELDADGDADADGGDADGDAAVGTMHFFTIRNFIGFFSMFGWSGVAMQKGGHGAGVSVLVATIIGSITMVLMAIFFRMILKLQSSGTFKLSQAMGLTGEVYSPIPANMEGSGKINVVMGEHKRELPAITKGEKLETGTTVKVINVSNDRLIVERSE